MSCLHLTFSRRSFRALAQTLYEKHPSFNGTGPWATHDTDQELADSMNGFVFLFWQIIGGKACFQHRVCAAAPVHTNRQCTQSTSYTKNEHGQDVAGVVSVVPMPFSYLSSVSINSMPRLQHRRQVTIEIVDVAERNVEKKANTTARKG